MPLKNGPTHEQYEDPTLAEIAQVAIDHILIGDSSDRLEELSGLLVFGVIRALRENDQLLHGSDHGLSDDQKERLAEVESFVDKAVAKRLHYAYFRPDGDEKRYELDTESRDYKQLSAATRRGDANLARKGPAADRYDRKRRQEAAVKLEETQAGPLQVSRRAV